MRNPRFNICFPNRDGGILIPVITNFHFFSGRGSEDLRVAVQGALDRTGSQQPLFEASAAHQSGKEHQGNYNVKKKFRLFKKWKGI